MLILQKKLVDVSFRIQVDKDTNVAVQPHYIGSNYQGVAQGEVFIFALTAAIAFIAEKMPDKKLQILKAVEALEGVLLEVEEEE